MGAANMGPTLPDLTEVLFTTLQLHTALQL